MSALFITATGTDVGKTFVTAGLIRALRSAGRQVDALKPVVSGFEMPAAAASDPGVLLAALGRSATPQELDRISPWRFKAPLSPDMAARLDGRCVDFEALVTLCRDRIAAADALLIEGVGGIMAPLDETHTVLDWMVALKLPVLLVAGSYLGTISHTLSALYVLERRGLRVAAVAVSETAGSTVGLNDTAAAIARFTAQRVIGLPRLLGAAVTHPAIEELAALV